MLAGSFFSFSRRTKQNNCQKRQQHTERGREIERDDFVMFGQNHDFPISSLCSELMGAWL